ncbi:hypothetical protein QUB68_25635 [Microcoleus sp. A006_D1]|uniref:hypothetical protein n=1 Tax=Microcoleus sp. A006_D1 TaxID=3055267 RepID=UPI002FCF000F
MATDKKHIAVYLDKAVEDALIEFCTANGMESKKGPMYSAAVNRALAQFFGISDTTPDTIPRTIPDNILSTIPSAIPDNIPSTIPDVELAERLTEIETQLSERFTQMEERLGKLRA